AIAQGEVKKTVIYVAITLALGGVFLGIKAVEYNSKFEHHILPGLIEHDSYADAAGMKYRNVLRTQLDDIIEKPAGLEAALVQKCKDLRGEIDKVRKEEMDRAAKGTPMTLSEQEAGIKKLSEEAEKILDESHGKLDHHRLSYVIPNGNTWVSCYFIM